MAKKNKFALPKHKAHMKSFGVPTDEDYQLIKELLPHPVSKEDLFVYSIKLCDNLLDREGEFFSLSSLSQIAELFLGVGGIFNHNWEGSQHHSRIYRTEVLSDETVEKTPVGEVYSYVVAYAYTLNTEENKTFLDKLKSGILREVSIGFEDDETVKVAYGDTEATRIDSVTDAYEWSFVSVPAQPFAGVVKSHKSIKKEEGNMSLVAAIARLKSLQGVDASAIQTLEEHLTSFKSLEKELSETKAKVKSLEEEVVSQTLNHAIESILTELKPVDAVAAELAADIATKDLTVEEDGSVKGVEDAVSHLKTKYSFLFEEVEPQEEKFEEEEEDINTKSIKKKSKGIDFSKYSNPAPAGVIENNKTVSSYFNSRMKSLTPAIKGDFITMKGDVN